MYTEGLRVLEKAVEDVGRADVQALTREAKQGFKHNSEVLFKFRDITSRYNDFENLDGFRGWYLTHALPELHRDRSLDGIGIKFVHGADSQRHFDEHVWAEPYRNGDLAYAHSSLPSLEPCAPTCRVVTLYDPITGEKGMNIYNFSEPFFPDDTLDMYRDRNIQPGETWWFPAVFWASLDNTPYIYIMHYMRLPPINNGIFDDGIGSVSVSLSTFPFEEFMLQYNTDADMLLAHTNEGLRSLVMAANFPQGRLDLNCSDNTINSVDSTACIKTLSNLTENHIKITLELNKTVDGKFRRLSGYWGMRTTVFEPEHLDLLPPLYLFWMRSIQKANDEMKAALFLFVGFLAGVFIFDIIIGFAEIILVAVPMVVLTKATHRLQTMDLDGSQSFLLKQNKVVEVEELRLGLSFAIERLREYKTFLPTMLFANDSTEGTESSREESKYSGSKATSTSVSIAVMDATSLGLSSTKKAGALVRIISDKAVRDVPDVAIFELIEDAATRSKGQLHGFGSLHFDTFFVTWTGMNRDVQSLGFCFAIRGLSQFHKAISMMASPKWMAGNTGTNTYRGFCLQGVPTENLLKSNAFSCYASRLGHQSIITSADSAKVISAVSVTTPVGKVFHEGNSTLVNEVLEIKEGDTGEWMYHFKEAENPLSELFANGKFNQSAFESTSPLQKKLAEIAAAKSEPVNAFIVDYSLDKFVTCLSVTK